MSEITDRIKELIDSEALSNTEFAKKIDTNPSIISHVLSGRNKPSLHLIEQIKHIFTNVNLDYLITGTGKLYGGFTNVKSSGSMDKSITTTPQLSFPMDGVRYANIPSGAPANTSIKDEILQQEPTTPSPKEGVPLPDTKTFEEKTEVKINPENEAIEQIVIFYKDGSFKAYRHKF